MPMQPRIWQLGILVLVFGLFFFMPLPQKFGRHDAKYELAQGVQAVEPAPIRAAVLQLINAEGLLKTIRQYVKIPFPGTGVKNVEVNTQNVSELNQQIQSETGVDLFKFARFIGRILVSALEGAARLIKSNLPGG